MQFYFIEKKTKNFLWDWYDEVLKSPPHWQMSAWASLPQQWAMTTWNKQTSTILARKPVAGKSSEKLQTTKLNCRDSFCLKGLVGGIGIMFKFGLLRFVKPKRGYLEVYIHIYAWLSRGGSFGIASVLQHLRATSTCCILSFSFIGESSALEFLQPFFLVTVRPTAGQSQSWTCGFHQIFA